MSVDQASLAKVMQSVDADRSRLAALAFLAWDIVVTLDEEVSLGTYPMAHISHKYL